MEYLGHTIRQEGVQVNPKKIEVMTHWPRPKILKNLRGFLGHNGYYKNVHNYGRIATSLTSLLIKNAFIWNDAVEHAFHALWEAMCTTPILAMLNFTKTFIL